MGQAYTQNPYKKGTPNYYKVQKQIKPKTTPKDVLPQESLLEKFNKTFTGATNPIENIDVSQDKIKGIEENPLEKINARARVEASSTRENNFLKSGFEPLDNLTEAFLSGSAFAGTALAETGGATGKLIPLKLNKLIGGAVKSTEKGLKFSSIPIKAIDTTIKTTAKYGIPIASTGLLIPSRSNSI